MPWCAHIPTLTGCIRCGRSDQRCATRNGLCRLCVQRDNYARVRDARNARRRERAAAERAARAPLGAPRMAASRARGTKRAAEVQRAQAAHRARDRAAVLSSARHETTGWHPRWARCLDCGTTKRPHHSGGRCTDCWRATHGLAGAVELWGEADEGAAWTTQEG